MAGSRIDSRISYPAESTALIAGILEALDSCIAIVNGEGRLVAFNSAWRHFARQPAVRETRSGDKVSLLDDNFPETNRTRQNRKRVDGLKRVIAGDTDRFSYDFVQPDDKEVRWYRVDAHRLDRPPGRAIFIVSDISARKRAEMDLRNSQDQLYQSQKMEALGTLVAGMAHEINNPTSLIMFNLPIVKRVWADVRPLLKIASDGNQHRKFGGYDLDFLENQFLQLIVDMDMAASRISKIVKDLKNFSRRSQIRDKAPINLNAAVTAAVRLAKTTIRKSGVKLSLNLSDDLPQIQGNLTSIEQVALNVIINAIQAIDHDEGRIAILTGEDRAEGNVYIAVHDNGPGISPEVADKIFDPFVTDKQGQGGTGLGLAVSYNLVQAHDGQISYTQPEEGGTVFTVAFPIEPKHRMPRVLVVDDDAMVRRLMLQAIEKSAQYQVDEADNGVDGLIKIGTHPPDLLILDLMMPGMNGLEVCQAIYKKEPFAEMKVLITTGHPHHPDLKKITALGFTNIHAKPFTIQGFLQAVATIMN